jgi:hypothetical protein
MQALAAGLLFGAALWRGRIVQKIIDVDILGVVVTVAVGLTALVAAFIFGTCGSYFPSVLFVLETIVKQHTSGRMGDGAN